MKHIRSLKVEAEALLFGAAGFLAVDIFERASSVEQKYLRELWAIWWKSRSEFGDIPLDWNYSGIRPGNHPHRRIGALVAVLGKWRKIWNLMFGGQEFGWKKLASVLEGLEHPFWSRHYTLTSGPAERPIALVGRARSFDILANQVFPILVREEPTLWDDYKQMPAPLENEKICRAKARLFGESAFRSELTKKVYQHQGLLQVYTDFCLEDSTGCEECPFPEQLRGW